MIDIIIIVIITILVSSKTFIKQEILKTFNIDETIFIKYLLKLLPVIIFLLIKTYYDVNKFKFLKKLDYKNTGLFLLNVSISLITGYLFLLLIKNYELSTIIPILSPLIILLTITIDKYLNNKKFTKGYYLGALLVIMGIVVLKKDTKKLDKLNLL